MAGTFERALAKLHPWLQARSYDYKSKLPDDDLSRIRSRIFRHGNFSRIWSRNFRSDNLSQFRPWEIGTHDPPEGERTEIAGVASTQGLHKQYYPSKARRGVVGVRPPLKVTNIISHQRADNAASTSVGDQVVDAVGATLYSIDW